MPDLDNAEAFPLNQDIESDMWTSSLRRDNRSTSPALATTDGS